MCSVCFSLLAVVKLRLTLHKQEKAKQVIQFCCGLIIHVDLLNCKGLYDIQGKTLLVLRCMPCFCQQLHYTMCSNSMYWCILISDVSGAFMTDSYSYNRSFAQILRQVLILISQIFLAVWLSRPKNTLFGFFCKILLYDDDVRKRKACILVTRNSSSCFHKI
jgi:hypothetical protein